MSKNLFIQAITKFFSGVLLTAFLIFLPAGTLSFFYGWLFMGILFLPMLLVGSVMLVKNPELLKKRLQTKEIHPEQRHVVKASGLMFCVGFILAGFNFRFGWHMLPKSVSITAALLLFASYLLYAQVLRENAYLSRTIEVQADQKVVDTGLYGIVRHPMYSATLLLFLAIPLVLGSLLSLLVFLVYPFIIAKRIRYEEALLEAELDGYRDYQSKVPYRLIPFLW